MFYVSDGTIYSTIEHLEGAGKDLKTSEKFSSYFEADHFITHNERPHQQSIFVAGKGASARIFDSRHEADQFSDDVATFGSQVEAQMYAETLSLDAEKTHRSQHVDVKSEPCVPMVDNNPAGIVLSGIPPAHARRKRILANINNAISEWSPYAELKEPLQFAEIRQVKKEEPEHVKEVKKEDTTIPADPEKSSIIQDIISFKDKSNAAVDTFRSKRVPKKSFMEQKKEKMQLRRSPRKPKQPEIVPDEYQQAACQAAIDGKSFFLTGSAGTGKSFVLKRIIKELRARGKNVAVTASTGCAAVGIQGSTIHSMAGVGIGMDPVETLIKNAKSKFVLQKRFRNLHTLIIDEISMVDSFLFDKIEAVISSIRKSASPQHHSKTQDASPEKRRRTDQTTAHVLPFGGLQVIVCGDFFQLPPVSASDYKHRDSSEKFFAFESRAWRRTIRMTFLLRYVHRQADRKFAGLLNEIRQGIVTDLSAKVLNATRISLRCDHVETDEKGARIHFTKLFAYRAKVEAENSMQLRKLQCGGLTYRAVDHMASKLGSMSKGSVVTLLRNLAAAESLNLKEGSRVLCLKNLDMMNGLVNGSSGVVIGFSLSEMEMLRRRAMGKKAGEGVGEADVKILDRNNVRDEDEVVSLEGALAAKWIKGEGRSGDGFVAVEDLSDVVPVVRFDNGVVRRMEAEKWDIFGMDGEVIAYRKQIPLTLGWALSIHKAQGMTLEHVETDVGRAFDFGQVYVALSRVTSIQGLRLKSFDRERVEAHPKVAEFYETAHQEGELKKAHN